MLNDYPVIKQIMPLPNGYTVLTPTYTTSTLNVCDPISVVYDDKCFYGTSYCLALVHDSDGFDYVAAHEIEVEGLGELEDHLIFAPIKMCPKCGERMFIHMEMAIVTRLITPAIAERSLQSIGSVQCRRFTKM